MADLQSILSDPNFQALPLPEKNKVLLRVDPNFRGLPPQERMKALSVIQYHKPLPEVPKPLGLGGGIRAIGQGLMLPIEGLGQAVLDIPETVGATAKAALVPPQTPEEDVAAGLPGGLLASRLVVQPAVGQLQKAGQTKGTEKAAHVAAAALPVVGPMAAQLGEGIKKPEDIPFTLGRALGWVELPEAGGKLVGKLVKPKAPLPSPEVVNEIMGRVVKDQFERADANLHAEVGKHADHLAQVIDDPARNPGGAINPQPVMDKLETVWNAYVKGYDPSKGGVAPAALKPFIDEMKSSPTGRWTFEQTKQVRTAVDDMIDKTRDARVRKVGIELSRELRAKMREAAENAGVEKDFDTYNRLHRQQKRISEAIGQHIKDASTGKDVISTLHNKMGYAELTLPALKAYGLEPDAVLDAVKTASKSNLTSHMWRGWMVRHASAELLSMLAGAPYMAGYFAGGIGGEMMAGKLSKAGRELAASPYYGRGMQLVKESLPEGPTPVSEPAPIPSVPAEPKAAPKVLPPLPSFPSEPVKVEATPVTEAAAEMSPSKYQGLLESMDRLRMLNAAIRKLAATGKRALTDTEIEWIGQQTGVDMTQPGAIAKARKALVEQRNALRNPPK